FTAQQEKTAVAGNTVQDVLPATGGRSGDVHALHRRIPGRAGDHAAVVAAHTNQHHIVAVALARELADVDHALPGHVGVASIADVRVVLPDDRLRCRTVMLTEPLQRLGHMPVADVPGYGTAAYQLPVILLGVTDDDRVLLGVEVWFIAVIRELGHVLP